MLGLRRSNWTRLSWVLSAAVTLVGRCDGYDYIDPRLHMCEIGVHRGELSIAGSPCTILTCTAALDGDVLYVHGGYVFNQLRPDQYNLKPGPSTYPTSPAPAQLEANTYRQRPPRYRPLQTFQALRPQRRARRLPHSSTRRTGNITILTMGIQRLSLRVQRCHRNVRQELSWLECQFTLRDVGIQYRQEQVGCEEACDPGSFKEL